MRKCDVAKIIIRKSAKLLRFFEWFSLFLFEILGFKQIIFNVYLRLMNNDNTLNMNQIVLNIPESEYSFFMKLITNFTFVEVVEERKKTKLKELENKLSPPKQKIWNDIKEGLEEVKQIEKGQKKAKTLNAFLNEL